MDSCIKSLLCSCPAREIQIWSEGLQGIPQPEDTAIGSRPQPIVIALPRFKRFAKRATQECVGKRRSCSKMKLWTSC